MSTLFILNIHRNGATILDAACMMIGQSRMTIDYFYYHARHAEQRLQYRNAHDTSNTAAKLPCSRLFTTRISLLLLLAKIRLSKRRSPPANKHCYLTSILPKNAQASNARSHASFLRRRHSRLLAKMLATRLIALRLA